MLSLHDLVPHLSTRTIDGRLVDYRGEIWQRRNLLLVCIGQTNDAATSHFVSEISAHRDELSALTTEIVVTREPMPGMPQPGLVIADRWGEIQTVVHVKENTNWPPIDDVLATLTWVVMRCPECEGEAR